MSRKDHRGNSELRSISIKKDINIHAEGSVEVSFHVDFFSVKIIVPSENN